MKKEEIKKVANNLLIKVQEARNYTEPYHPAKLFEICEDLIKGQAWLIIPLLESETAYRQKVIDFKNEEIVENGKIIKISNVEADNKAKTTEEYTNYKFLKYVYSIIEQQILLIKKFSDKLDSEKDRY